jgi:hypothetical protein
MCGEEDALAIRALPFECRHDILGKPLELVLEFLGRHVFGLVNHHLVKAWVPRLKLSDLLDDERKDRKARPSVELHRECSVAALGH